MRTRGLFIAFTAMLATVSAAAMADPQEPLSDDEVERLFQQFPAFCYDRNDRGECAQVDVIRRMTSDSRIIFDSFVLLPGPTEGFYTKIVTPGTAGIAGNSVCTPMTVDYIDQSSLFMSEDPVSEISSSDYLIAEDDGVADFRAFMKRMLAPELTGDVLCYEIVPWELRGGDVSAYKLQAYVDGHRDDYWDREMRMYDVSRVPLHMVE